MYKTTYTTCKTFGYGNVFYVLIFTDLLYNKFFREMLYIKIIIELMLLRDIY